MESPWQSLNKSGDHSCIFMQGLIFSIKLDPFSSHSLPPENRRLKRDAKTEQPSWAELWDGTETAAQPCQLCDAQKWNCTHLVEF